MSSLPPPTSNHVTDAAAKAGDAYIRIESNGTPQMSRIILSDGRSLGLVQSATWSIGLDNYASLHVETIASPADLKVLLRDTSLSIRPAKGYNPFRYLWDWTVAWCYTLLNRS